MIIGDIMKKENFKFIKIINDEIAETLIGCGFFYKTEFSYNKKIYVFNYSKKILNILQSMNFEEYVLESKLRF